MGCSTRRWNRSIAGMSLWFLSIVHGSAQPAAAGFLSPTDEAMEALVGNQVDDMLSLVVNYGSNLGPLTFISQFDPTLKTYSYRLAPGSTVNGLSLQLATSGAYDAGLGAWVATSAGSLGNSGWVGSGTFTFTDPPGRADETSSYTVNGVHVDDTRSFIDDPLDPLRLLSFETYLITELKTQKTYIATGIDSDRKTIDELNPEYTVGFDFGPANGRLIVGGTGVVDAKSGAGRFVVTTSVVPEPASLVLLGVGLACGLVRAQRSSRSIAPRRSSGESRATTLGER